MNDSKCRNNIYTYPKLVLQTLHTYGNSPSHNQQQHSSICKFQTDRLDPMWVRFPALNSFLGLERRFDHQKNGLDVAEATVAMACARDSRKQARNSEQRRTTSNRCSSAVIGRRKMISRVIGWKSLWGCELPSGEKKIWNASRICVSSLRRGHANLLCIVPILVYVPPKRVQVSQQIMAAWCSTGTTYEETCQSPPGKGF